MNFPSQIFFNNVNNGYKTAILKNNSLWLLPFFRLWLLLAIMKRCVERCALQFYRTSLIGFSFERSNSFLVIQSDSLKLITEKFIGN